MKFSGISPRQIRAARMLLGWSQADLAKHAQVSITVIARIETDAVDARVSTLMAILKAFDEHGVEFVTEGDGREGIMCRPRPRHDGTRRRPESRSV